MSEALRQEFEAWCVTQGWKERPKARENGTYVNGQLQARWIGWQAARAGREGEPKPRIPGTDPRLLERFAKDAGMVSLLNMGAASCVHSEGCNGVTQAHLTKYTEIVAAYCVQAMAEMIGAPIAPAGDPGDAGNALPKSNPLSKGRCLHNVRMDAHCAFCVDAASKEPT